MLYPPNTKGRPTPVMDGITGETLGYVASATTSIGVARDTGAVRVEYGCRGNRWGWLTFSTPRVLASLSR